MSAGQAVLVVGVSLVIVAVMIAVMIRLERVQRRRIERRREAFRAAVAHDLTSPNWPRTQPSMTDLAHQHCS
jgi:hypothetical protein